ncbi:MAG: DUF5678 domain-containing protein [Blastocatellia bacterium]|nr:DUF5678 domain-containing protein [Blastocatellia bacterium]
MNDRPIITEEPEDLNFNQRLDRFRRNGEWLTEHGASLFEQYPGQYIATSEGEVFVSDDALEARRMALEKHPGDEPFVQYVPRESYERIYKINFSRCPEFPLHSKSF